MVVNKKIKQNTIEWHEVRWGKIGGTLAKGLYIKTDTLMLDLLSQQCEDFEPTDDYKNEHMQRGHDMQPFAQDFLEKYTGLKFENPAWLQYSRTSILGLSPDGLTKDHKVGAEIKCFARKRHAEILLADEIPKDILPQLLQYFVVNPKCEKVYFISFRPENKVRNSFVRELTLDSVIDLGWTKSVEIKQYSKVDSTKEIKPLIVKESDPKTVRQWVKIARAEGVRLQKEIDDNILKIVF